MFGGRRKSLDELVRLLVQPGFASRLRRVPEPESSSAHVSPELLAVVPPRSRYVRKWRRHARNCPYCAAVFRYYGIKV